MADNIPLSASVQDIEFRSESLSVFEEDEDFFERGVRTLRASVYLSRVFDNQRRVLAYFHEPFEVRGARILLIEKESGNETFLYAPVFGDVRRLTGRHISSSVSGTDFSYEDLEQLYAMAKGGSVTRLADAELNGKEVYVLKSVSSAGSDSTYQRI
ncbi:MAG: outer membrane lipoprotein-sorting protein, partial [Pseudomonadota bacterium]